MLDESMARNSESFLSVACKSALDFFDSLNTVLIFSSHSSTGCGGGGDGGIIAVSVISMSISGLCTSTYLLSGFLKYSWITSFVSDDDSGSVFTDADSVVGSSSIASTAFSPDIGKFRIFRRCFFSKQCKIQHI